MSTAYFENIVLVLKDYLGPAAERFARRQVAFHLTKNPEDLTHEEAEKLGEWCRAALGMVTDDKSMVEEAVQRMNKVVATQ